MLIQLAFPLLFFTVRFAFGEFFKGYLVLCFTNLSVLYWNHIHCPGLVISGGEVPNKTVEVYIPSTGQVCSLPHLPKKRAYHTMDSRYICGGQGTASTSCIHFSSGHWITTHTLTEERDGHSSWETDRASADGRISQPLHRWDGDHGCGPGGSCILFAVWH